MQFGIRIEYWLLPYVNLVIDILQSQSAAGAIPHVLGILTGHIYHFFSVIWPQMGGKRYFAPPRLLESTLEGKPRTDEVIGMRAFCVLVSACLGLCG